MNQYAPPEIRELAAEARKKELRILLDIVRLRARRGCGGERFFFANAVENRPPWEQYSIALRMIRELQGLPDAEKRTYELSRDLLQPEPFKTYGQVFLDQLRAIDNQDVQAAVKTIEKRVEETRRFFEEKNDEWAPPIWEDSKLIRMRQVRFLWPANVSQPKEGSPFLGYLPLDKGDDLAWYSQYLFLVKPGGELKKIWAAGTTKKMVIQIRDVQYDGRYVWLSTNPTDEDCGLFIIEPNSGQSWEVKKEDGLPRVSQETARDYSPFIKVAPLSQGKALVISWFGRTAMALASFNPRTGAKVSVFHEARETGEVNDPHSWKSDKMAFSPEYVAVSKNALDPSRNVVLVGRASRFSSLTINPLVVRPHEKEVHVLSHPAFHRTVYPVLSTIAHDGIYQLETQIVGKPEDYDDDTLALCRIAPPDYKAVVIRDNMPGGWLLRSGDRTHIVGKRWWTLDRNPDSGDLQLRILANQLPWYYGYRSRAGRNYDQEEELRPSSLHRPVVHSITESNHFGILVMVRQTHRGKPATYRHYQVNLREPTEDRHAEPSTR